MCYVHPPGGHSAAVTLSHLMLLFHSLRPPHTPALPTIPPGLYPLPGAPTRVVAHHASQAHCCFVPAVCVAECEPGHAPAAAQVSRPLITDQRVRQVQQLKGRQHTKHLVTQHSTAQHSMVNTRRETPPPHAPSRACEPPMKADTGQTRMPLHTDRAKGARGARGPKRGMHLQRMWMSHFPTLELPKCQNQHRDSHYLTQS